jgi:hypothetical protein
MYVFCMGMQRMPFCDTTLDVDTRAADYVKRLPDDLKPGMMVCALKPDPCASGLD